MDMSYFLKKFNMRKIHKISNIALIFMLGGVFLCQELAYALRPPLHSNIENENFIQSQQQEGSPQDKKTPIPQDTIEKLQLILFCSEAKSTKICELILSFFLDKEKEVSSYGVRSATEESRDSPSILHTYVSEDRDFISIVGHNHSAIRFFYIDGQLFIMEVSPLNRGNIIYEEQEKLLALAKNMSDKIKKIIGSKGITNEDLNKLFWVIPKDKWFIGDDGVVRPLYNDEMYVVLKKVSDGLIEAGFFVDEEVGYSKDFMDDMGKIGEHGGVGYRVSLEARVEEHHTFFDAFTLEDDEFVVFLARDAISAYEFLNYLDSFGDIKSRSGLVYQPGLPYYFNWSNYKKNDKLSHVMGVTSEIFHSIKREMGIPAPKGYDGDPDEREFDENLYREFSKRFKEKLAVAIETDEVVRQESEFIYKQLQNIGALNYKKIRVVDLHATGRTIYYIKSVLEYFAEKEGIRFDGVDGFVGFGRGEGVGLPKVTHQLPSERVHFTDVFWPFYMNSRNYNTGIVRFYAMHSRYMVLLHAYHSLRLFNESVVYFRRKQGLSLHIPIEKDKLLLAKDQEQKKERRRRRTILELKRSEFLRSYRRKGYFRPGFFGEDRQVIFDRLNEWFGEGNWKIGHMVEGQFISPRKALDLYEDAYFEFFKTQPDELEWLVKNAKDVYDNSLSNIESGTNYDKQEKPDHHYQDIAIRRVLKRLGRKFEGDEYIQIRGLLSKGYRLNPGLVPFHRLDLLLRPELSGWWKPNSVESFYQSTKVIILEDSILPVETLSKKVKRQRSVVNGT